MAGGFVVFIGYLLSPLSWWNDAFVNIPLALVFAWVIGLIYRPASIPDSPAFRLSVLVGYWITNIAGLVLMQKGAQTAATAGGKKYTRRDLLKDLVVSLLYTGLIMFLIKLGLLKPLKVYFKPKAG
jgi:hypothetical protein